MPAPRYCKPAGERHSTKNRESRVGRTALLGWPRPEKRSGCGPETAAPARRPTTGPCHDSSVPGMAAGAVARRPSRAVSSIVVLFLRLDLDPDHGLDAGGVGRELQFGLGADRHVGQRLAARTVDA